MYTREQASQLRQQFWTTFGQYLTPLLSAEGMRVNWINYKTGAKHVYFRMNADKKQGSIAIELTHPDVEMQQLVFEQLLEHKTMLHEALGEEWEWALHTTDENDRTVSRIYKEIAPANVFNKDDWPKLISFFKPRIIALDAFWSDARYSFEE
ncbi:DUF4268 domain-containing protein [Pontibacter akesuensis]|uniref:DUF4268 domain-containing protein n=1 Tax=Pontibacter akesuensis TaxID=388950 RepID=A0A1I7FUH2_9BACT|nr:DUF4268 domain-containing protein [Pontibacter akesuensis]GHA60448.1 hypothetical protein GCM10007389_10870 [Pontibacter akesuensis]SFU39800.1 protein of unknown function [Pontibacter akesuensis]